LIRVVAGRQEHQDITLHRVAFKVSLQRRAVHLDVLHHDGRRAGHHRWYVGLDLCRASADAGEDEGEQTGESGERFRWHLDLTDRGAHRWMYAARGGVDVGTGRGRAANRSLAEQPDGKARSPLLPPPAT